MEEDDKVERKTMKVKGGQAWIIRNIYSKPRLVMRQRLEKESDGRIRNHVTWFLMSGEETGNCPECHQMPCPHTAKLLGW